MDNINIKIPYSKKIDLPIELFNFLPKKQSDDLQQDLMNMYYAENPQILKKIIDYSANDPNLMNMKKEEYFNNIMSDEYAFDVEILRKRTDPIAEQLVREIDTFNGQVETVSQGD